jgi:cytochrome c553
MIKKTLFRTFSLPILLTISSVALDMSACIGCHGEQFEKPAMNTSRVVKDLTPKEMLEALNGYKDESKGGAMQSVMNRQMANYTKDEIEELVENIFTHHITIEHNSTQKSNERNLTEYVNNDNCVRCHGLEFEKPAMGSSRIVNQMSKEDIVASINGYKAGTYGGRMKALMAGIAIHMSQEEIEAIAEKFGKKPTVNERPLLEK